MKLKARLGIAAVIICLLLPATTFAAAVTINFYVGKDLSGANQALVEKYNSMQSKVKVILQEMPPSSTEQHDKYVTVLAARNSSIDVMAADIPWAPEFAAAGWLLPLSKRLDKNDLADIFAGPLLGTTYRREVYAIPWFNNAGVMLYRKDLLSKAGISAPRTFDELVAGAKKTQSDNVYGYVWQGAQYEGGAVNWFEIFWGMGGEFLDDDGNLIANRNIVARSMQWLSDLVHVHKVTPAAVTTWKEADGEAVFLAGRGVFHRAWPSVYARSLTPDVSKIVGQVGITQMVGEKGPGSTCLGTWNLAISRYTKHPDEAWDFVNFMISPEAQKIKAIIGGNPPVRKTVFGDPDVVAKYPHFRSLYDVFVGALPRPVDPAYPQISVEAIQPNFAAVMARSLTAQKAADNLIATTKEALAKAH